MFWTQKSKQTRLAALELLNNYKTEMGKISEIHRQHMAQMEDAQLFEQLKILNQQLCQLFLLIETRKEGIIPDLLSRIPYVLLNFHYCAVKILNTYLCKDHHSYEKYYGEEKNRGMWNNPETVLVRRCKVCGYKEENKLPQNTIENILADSTVSYIAGEQEKGEVLFGKNTNLTTGLFETLVPIRKKLLEILNHTWLDDEAELCYELILKFDDGDIRKVVASMRLNYNPIEEITELRQRLEKDYRAANYLLSKLLEQVNNVLGHLYCNRIIGQHNYGEWHREGKVILRTCSICGYHDCLKEDLTERERQLVLNYASNNSIQNNK